MPPLTSFSLLLLLLLFEHGALALATYPEKVDCPQSEFLDAYKCKHLMDAWACPSKDRNFNQAQRADYYRKNSCPDTARSKFEPPELDLTAGCVANMEACHTTNCGDCKLKIEQAAAAAAEAAEKKKVEAARKAAVEEARKRAEIDAARKPVTPVGPVTTTGPEFPKQGTGELATREALERAAAEQRRAAAEASSRRREVTQGNEIARDNKLSTITNAADILDNWKRSLDGNPIQAPDSQRKYRSDLQLFHKARVSLDSASPNFSRSDAERAFDVGVRRELTEHAESVQIEKWTGKEGKRLKAEEEKFLALEKVTLSRAQKMGWAKNEAGFAGSNAPVAAAGSGPRTAFPNASSLGGDRKSRGEEPAPSTISSAKGDSLESGSAGHGFKRGFGAAGGSATHAAGQGEAQDKDKRTKAVSYARIPSLRELLRDRMNKEKESEGKGLEGVNKDAFEGATFSETLNQSSLLGSAQESAAASKSLAEDMLQGIKTEQRPLGMVIDTEAASREIASALHGGLLGLETQNLFERVRQAHRACQSRNCVNSH